MGRGGILNHKEAAAYTWSRVLYIALGLIVGGVGLCFSLRKVEGAAVLAALQTVEPPGLIMAICCSFGVAVLKTARWYRLFVPDQRGLDGWATFSILILAQLTNTMVPVRGGGEALRIGLMTRHFPVSALRVGATLILEKFFDLLSLALIALSIVPAAVQIVGESIFSTTLGLLVIVGGLGGIILVFYLRDALMNYLQNWAIAARFLDRLATGFSTLHSSSLVWELVGWTLAVRCLSLVSLFAALHSVRVTIPLLGILMLHVLLNFGYFLPKPPGLIGLVQYVALLVLVPFGIARGRALGAAIILHLVIMLPQLLLALPSWGYILHLEPGRAK